MDPVLKQRIQSSPIGPHIPYIKKFTLPGFGGIPLYEVAVFFIKEIRKEAISIRASALAFHFFLALFPAVIFLFTLIPYIPVLNMERIVLETLGEMLTGSAYRYIYDTIQDLIRIERGGLLSFGFLMTLFFSINGISFMMSAFGKEYEPFRRRNFFLQKLIAVELALLYCLLMAVSAVVVVGGEHFMVSYLNLEKGFLVSLLRWGIILPAIFAGISLSYRLGVPAKRKWPFITPGAIVATFLAVCTSAAFSYYVNHFGRFNLVFGSLGAIMVSMLWTYINSMALLIGFELNVSISVTKERSRGEETGVRS